LPPADSDPPALRPVRADGEDRPRLGHGVHGTVGGDGRGATDSPAQGDPPLVAPAGDAGVEGPIDGGPDDGAVRRDDRASPDGVSRPADALELAVVELVQVPG